MTGADVVVDCTDSFEARYSVNDACCAQGVPLVEAGVVGFDGLVLSMRPGESACYRCAFPTAPPPEGRRRCRDAGVLGAMAGVVGSIQALEALKLLAGVGEPAAGPHPPARRPGHEPDPGGHGPPCRLPRVCPRARCGTILTMLGLGTFTRVARELRADLTAAHERDPAARAVGRAEILLTYGGVQALLAHRVAHALHDAGIPLAPRAAGQRDAGSPPAWRSTRRPRSARRCSSTTAPEW